MAIEVKVGACIGVNQLQAFKDFGLGNFVYLHLAGVHHIMWDGPDIIESPQQLEEYRKQAIQAATFCRRNRIYFTIAEIRNRRRLITYSPYRKEDFTDIEKAGGKYFLGRFTIGESGGTVYWPKEYLHHSPLGADMNYPDAKNMLQAKQFYIQRIKRAIQREQKLGGQPWWLVCSSMLHKYHLEAGIEVPVLEVMPGPCDFLYSAIRGAANGFKKTRWGAHIAITWYGGCTMDPLWFKRWKMSLYTAYIAGAELIYSEHGHFGNSSLTNKATVTSKESQQYREILKKFYSFCQDNPRPKIGPKVKIGIIHGNLDGSGGLWNKWVWGQFKGDHWKHSDPENSWNLFNQFYRKSEWYTPTLTGDYDTTGNPPCGQVDIIPIESSPKVLNRYACLLFLGWNTCTAAMYSKLKNYVKQGGHLWISLPHLSTETKREEELNLVHNGNWHDLFGVRVLGKGKTVHAGIKFIERSTLPAYSFPTWGLRCDPKFIGNDIAVAKLTPTTGRVLAVTSTTPHVFASEKEGEPILIENRYGKGIAFLVTAWSYPGHPGLELFWTDIIRAIIQGEQDAIQVIGSDRIRYGFYQENGKEIMYLFNTDYDNPQTVSVVSHQKIVDELVVPQHEMYVYKFKKLRK